MLESASNDMDYAAALLHGRRSHMAEGERLAELCRRARTLPDLVRLISPRRQIQTVEELQRQLAQDLADELWALVKYLPTSGKHLLLAMLARFQLENLKLVIRGVSAHIPFAKYQDLLLELAPPLGFDAAALASLSSLDMLVKAWPIAMGNAAAVADAYRNAETIGPVQTQLFFIETTLDRDYFLRLLRQLEQLSIDEQNAIASMIFQEIDIYHLLLIVRGKFFHPLPADLLLGLHIPGTHISKTRFAAMLKASGLDDVVKQAAGRVFDIMPSAPKDPAAMELLAWKRFYRMANKAFRRSPIGLGTVIGYAGLRRIEVANQITLSEGIRARLKPEETAKHFVTGSASDV